MNLTLKNKHFTLIRPFTAMACLLGLYLTACVNKQPEGAGADWAHYLGHPTSNQYSVLKQINKDNVDNLEVAWTYATGDSAMYQTNNLIVDGKLYTATPHSRVVALDGATGERRCCAWQD